MNILFVRSFRSAASIDVTTLTPESSKSLAHLCHSLLKQTDDIRDTAVRVRVRSRLETQLLAAHKRSKAS